MQNFSLHTHTIGFDGQNSEAEMVAKALDLGWTHIGFSNHFIVHPKIKDAPMYAHAQSRGYHHIYSSSFDEAIAKFEPHYKNINELQKDVPIKILKGMEVDYFAAPEWQQGFSKALAHLKPDYLVGSAHFVFHKDTLYNSHDLKSAQPQEQNLLLHRYWQNERAAAQSGIFDILAHLDLMKKVGLGKEEIWIEEEKKTIAAIKKSGAVVELNTSAFAFGAEPYPSSRIMQMLAQQRIPAIISDDAHAAGQLGRHFDEALDISRKYGVKNFVKPEHLCRQQLLRTKDISR